MASQRLGRIEPEAAELQALKFEAAARDEAAAGRAAEQPRAERSVGSGFEAGATGQRPQPQRIGQRRELRQGRRVELQQQLLGVGRRCTAAADWRAQF
ncbi:hypothetical protein, partial [Methylibium sp. T29-B]|uniref:hypothetical protein n=1 Tax=Methylibium sp. T29-B TaxID=1437443 RepID=UPI0012DDB928